MISGALSYRFFRFEVREIIEADREKALLIAEVIKSGLATVMLEGRGAEPQSYINSFVAEDIETVRLLGSDGRIMYSSQTGDTEAAMQSEDLLKLTGPQLSAISSESQRPLYRIKVPLFNERPCQRCHIAPTNRLLGVLSMELSMQNVLRTTGEIKKRGVLYFITSLLVLSALLAVMTTYLVNRPLNGIVGTMRKVEEGDLQVRFKTRREDEIGMLALSFNSMLDKLGKMRQELESCHVDAMQRVEKMATIGELAAAIAHEIKNPLAGISGAMQVFAEDFPEDDPRKNIINDVLGEIERLDRTIRDLLSFARPPDPHPVKTPVTPVIERAVRIISAQAKKQDVDIELALTEEHPFHIDPEQMQQVFLNIMLNALHSMPGGGKITITTQPTEQGTEILIADTGRGISSEELKNVFRPFYTTKYTGTGLGLSISKNIVEKHGGKLAVESRPGVGSTFRIALPVEVRNG